MPLPEGVSPAETAASRGPSRRPASSQSPYNLLYRSRAWLLRTLSRRESYLFLVLSVLIGLASGLLVVCFRLAIECTHQWFFGPALTPPAWRLLLIPSAAGLVIGACSMRFFPRVRTSGVNQTKAAVYVYDGYIDARTVVGKFLLCALGIGSGQSLGPEDPSLQIGAGVASSLGRWFHLSRAKLRMMAPVGAAAGLAAAFNAPISGTIFVLEEIIDQWNAGVLGSIILAAAASVVVLRAFLGSQPLFRVPPYRLVNASELLAYAVLGIIGGFASLVFVKLIRYLRPPLKALPSWTFYVQPALAGLAVGLMGLRFPQVMGAGYSYIDQAIHGAYSWQLLALLAVLKIFATSFSFVSGTPGGMFAPTLFIGAMIGEAVGGVERHFFPMVTGPVGAYALVGMGTLFAGFLRAPMTSVFMVLEVSGNYSIILPVMVSNTIAYLISRNYQPVPLFDMLSRQDGLDLPSMEEQREEAVLRVEDAMRPLSSPILMGTDTVAQALERIGKRPDAVFLVDQGNFDNAGWSAVTKKMLEQEALRGNGSQTLHHLASSARLPWVHPDQRLDVAIRLIGDRPLIPVVNRFDHSRLEGVVSLEDILGAYRKSPVSPGVGAEGGVWRLRSN
jgi:CIC family chloride channel protein